MLTGAAEETVKGVPKEIGDGFTGSETWKGFTSEI